MSECFAQDVQEIVGPALFEQGFQLDEVDDRPDSGGRERHVVYYRSNDSKVQIYKSSRDGSVNCMIAPVDTPNEFGPNAQRWQYIRRFAAYPDLPFDELMAVIDAEYDSYPDDLHWVRGQIAKHLNAARAGIQAMYQAGNN